VALEVLEVLEQMVHRLAPDVVFSSVTRPCVMGGIGFDEFGYPFCSSPSQGEAGWGYLGVWESKDPHLDPPPGRGRCRLDVQWAYLLLPLPGGGRVGVHFPIHNATLP
jgi:hypothetical protein